MDRRHVLGRLLGLAAVPVLCGGKTAVARGRIAADDPVAHRPDVRRFQPHRRGVGPIAFSPDGGRLVTVGRDDQIKVWDAATCREILALDDADRTTFAVAYSRDGSRIATAGVDGWIERPIGRRGRAPAGYAVWVRDATSGRERAKIKGPNGFGAIAFGADSDALTTLNSENVLQVWDVDRGREIATIEGSFSEGNRQTAVTRSVAFDAGARRVVLSTYDVYPDGTSRRPPEATLKLWDLEHREFRPITPRVQLQLDSAGRDVLLSPDGSLIVTTYYDLDGHRPEGGALGLQKAAILDFTRGTIVRRTEPDLEVYESLLAFSPDGRRFLSAREDGILRLWDAATGRIARTIKGPEGVDVPDRKGRTIQARAVAFLPRGIRVASGGYHCWNEVDPTTGQIKRDPATGEVLVVEPLQVWDAELDWAR